MKVLDVKNVNKNYPSFKLYNISFCLEEGRIMGFIGRNGAGKSTTLKAIINMVHADDGEIEIIGLDINENERAIKQRIGYTSGAVDYYKKKKISKLLDITKKQYVSWDDSICQKYLDIFSIDINKTPTELSEGMKVKLSLVLALSHGAELLILDEPTSGLDPVSRNELLEIFMFLKRQGVSILFSTHITSDLEKCADDITYIREGQIVYTGSVSGFTHGEKLEDVMIRYESEVFHENITL